MYSKSMIIALLTGVLASGCVSNHSILTNAQGKQTTCAANGFGIIGSIAASSMYQSCKDRAIAAGYHE